MKTKKTSQTPETPEFPPVYQHSFQKAVERGEMEEFRASQKLNVECAKAIDAVMEKYHDGVTAWKTEPAAREIIEQFGCERTLAVLANTIRHYSWDGRFSEDNREWARTMPRLDEQGACLVSANAGWLNAFTWDVLYEYQLTKPLNEAEIRAEAKLVLKRFREISEPNSPDRTRYLAHMSPEFRDRARPDDLVKMIKLLPFSNPLLTTLPKQKGFLVVISSEEKRNQHLRLRKPSIKERLAEKPTARERPAGKSKAREER